MTTISEDEERARRGRAGAHKPTSTSPLHAHPVVDLTEPTLHPHTGTRAAKEVTVFDVDWDTEPHYVGSDIHDEIYETKYFVAVAPGVVARGPIPHLREWLARAGLVVAELERDAIAERAEEKRLRRRSL